MKIADILDKTKNSINWELFECGMMSRSRISTDVIIEMESKLRVIVELLPEIKEALAACMVDSLSDRERTHYFNISEKLDKWEQE